MVLLAGVHCWKWHYDVWMCLAAKNIYGLKDLELKIRKSMLVTTNFLETNGRITAHDSKSFEE